MHNLAGYDAQFITKGLKKGFGRISCIPQTQERMLSLSIGANLRLLDSAQFLNASLQELVQNCPKHKFNHLRKHYETYADDEFELLLRKGVFPYDWFNDVKKLDYEGLPSKSKFHSQLNNEEISDDEYSHAKKVYKTFECDNFGDYHDLYLTCDVYQLAACVQHFRHISMKAFQIDPCHTYSLPGFAFQCMLKYTGVKLDLLKDSDMYTWLEGAIRGGLTTVPNRWAEANNERVSEYDKKQKNSWIRYYDANSLYPHAMRQYLPVSHFRWGKPADVPEHVIRNWNTKKSLYEGKHGMFLEVDMTIPDELHDKLSDLPPAPENLVVTKEMLSDYQKELSTDLGDTKEQAKLIASLLPKKRYVAHVCAISRWMQLGAKLDKVHRVMYFKQSNFLKKYVDFCVQQRALAADKFESNLWKMFMNSVFGKTIQNSRKHVQYDLVTDSQTLNRRVCNPRIKNVRRFSDDLVGVEMTKGTVKLDKPIFLGVCILDIAKSHLYDHHYNVMQKEFPGCRLLYSDTDSLTYQLFQDPNKVCQKPEIKEKFDFSNYPKDHILYDDTKKMIPGKFKDECQGKEIKEWISIRAKCYSYVMDEDDKEMKKIGGIRACVINNEITHKMYKDCLEDDRTVISKKQNSIRSKDHVLHSVTTEKIAMTSLETKRYWISPYESLPYGHYNIST